MVYQTPTKINQLYEEDYNIWLESTIQQLKISQFSEVDWANLIEELEDKGRSEKRAIYSNLKILLVHLLKYHYQSEKRSKRWLSTICEHRQRLHRAFKESPSLKNYFDETLNDSYKDAKELASTETGLNLMIFPQDCPFSKENILDQNYLP